MPNGRSGGFVIEKADLKHLVEAFPDGTVVAKIVAHSSLPRSVDALEIARFVDECPNDRIAVEEQDHKFYIIHLSNEPETHLGYGWFRDPTFFGTPSTARSVGE